LASIENLSEDIASEFAEMVYEATYYTAYSHYRCAWMTHIMGVPMAFLNWLRFLECRLGFVREARQVIQGVLKQNPNDKRAQDLSLLLEDTGSAFAKGGLLFFGVLVVGAAIAYRVYRSRTGQAPANTQ
jgi:hypothetical protein